MRTVLLFGMTTTVAIFLIYLWSKQSIVNSPVLNFEVSQTGTAGMYIKYQMAVFDDLRYHYANSVCQLFLKLLRTCTKKVANAKLLYFSLRGNGINSFFYCLY